MSSYFHFSDSLKKKKKPAEVALAGTRANTLSDVMATKLCHVTDAENIHVSVAGWLPPLCKHDLKCPRVKRLSWKQRLTLWTCETKWPQASKRPAGWVRGRRGRNWAGTRQPTAPTRTCPPWAPVRPWSRGDHQGAWDSALRRLPVQEEPPA